MITKFLSFAYLTIFGLTIISFLKYRGVIANYLYLPLWQIIALFLSVLLIARLTGELSLERTLLARINKIIIPIAGILVAIFFYIEAYNYPNFVHATLGINHFALVHLLNLSYFFYLLTQPTQNLKRTWQIHLFISFLLICFFLYSFYPAIFSQLSLNAGGEYDDNAMEWLQVSILIVGTVISANLFIKKAATFLEKSIYALAIAAFIFLIGEEISWGQRLLNLQLAPSTTNYQHELNIHNQTNINELTAFLYYAIFLYALISWLIAEWFKKKKQHTHSAHNWLQIFTFQKTEVIYLIPTFIFNPYADRTLIPGQPTVLDLYTKWGIAPNFEQTLLFLATWRETFEVLFYAALVLHVFNLYRQYLNAETENT